MTVDSACPATAWRVPNDEHDTAPWSAAVGPTFESGWSTAVGSAARPRRATAFRSAVGLAFGSGWTPTDHAAGWR